jgi:hypothetical protein
MLKLKRGKIPGEKQTEYKKGRKKGAKQGGKNATVNDPIVQNFKRILYNVFKNDHF